MRASDLAALRAVASEHGLRLLALHGSRATGRARRDSDLDLAAWYGDGGRAVAGEHALWEAVIGALPAGAPPVDLAILDLADPLLQFMVATEGQPIFEADGGAVVEFRLRASAAYHDSAPQRAALRAWLRAFAAARLVPAESQGGGP